MGMLFNCLRSGSPVIVTAGQQDTRLQFGEPALWSDLVGMAAALTLGNKLLISKLIKMLLERVRDEPAWRGDPSVSPLEVQRFPDWRREKLANLRMRSVKGVPADVKHPAFVFN